MNLLVITYAYYPDLDPRAFRWTAICEQWAKSGHEVHVVTGSVLACKRAEVQNNVSIHRVGYGLLENFRQWANAGKIGSGAVSAGVKTKARVNGKRAQPLAIWMKRWLKTLHDLTWRKIYWPDATCFWIWPAWRLSRSLIAQIQFDALVTVSHPFSGHVVGLLLKSSSPNLRWIADSGDPFCFLEESAPNNFNLYRNLNHWVERKILKSVHYSSVTTEKTADIYRDLFPESAQKMSVIPPLLRVIQLPSIPQNRELFKESKIAAVYVGGWHKNIREPDWVLSIFNRLVTQSEVLSRNMELHFFGSPKPIEEVLFKYPQLNERVVIHGLVPPTAAMKAMCQADVLVNVGNKTAYQLPSKLVEYIASGKPILNICHFNHDSSSLFLREYANFKDVLYQSESGENGSFLAVVEFVERCKAMAMDPEDVKVFIDRYAATTLAERYLHIAGLGGR